MIPPSGAARAGFTSALTWHTSLRGMLRRCTRRCLRECVGVQQAHGPQESHRCFVTCEHTCRTKECSTPRGQTVEEARDMDLMDHAVVRPPHDSSERLDMVPAPTTARAALPMQQLEDVW